MTEAAQDHWRKCSSCKKPIEFARKYFICSVSTCNGQRTGYVFCSVPCFERHLPGARHKDAGAVEKTAPTREAYAREQSSSSETAAAAARTPERRVIVTATGSQPVPPPAGAEKEVLIIASRLKDYITAKSGFNTSASVMDALSEIVRIHTDRAIEVARADGRKTVMDRDFKF